MPFGCSFFHSPNVSSSWATRLSFAPFRGPAIAVPVICCQKGPCLLIAHQKILVVDACQMKVQLPPLYAAGPDQTRVAQRSIGDDDGQLMQPIIHDMVIPHLANGIRAALPAERDRDDHVFRVDTGLLDGDVARLSERVVHHLFIRIDPCRSGRDQSYPHSRRQQQQPRDPACASPDKQRADRDQEEKSKQNRLVVERVPKGRAAERQAFAPERGGLHTLERGRAPGQRGSARNRQDPRTEFCKRVLVRPSPSIIFGNPTCFESITGIWQGTARSTRTLSRSSSRAHPSKDGGTEYGSLLDLYRWNASPRDRSRPFGTRSAALHDATQD